MYRIGMFSKINKVTIKTLRYYDEVGLLKPAYVDEENGYIPSDNPRESYIDGIWNKDNPEEWLTEIQVPIINR